MLKKKYKPSRLNKWYTKHFILAPCMRGLEVPEVTVVWWCFFASIFNSSLISLNVNNAGQAFIVLFKRDGNAYVRDQSFFADTHILYVCGTMASIITNRLMELFTKLRLILHPMNNN